MKKSKIFTQSILAIVVLYGISLPLLSTAEMKKGNENEKKSITGQEGREMFMKMQSVEKRAKKLENEIMAPCCFGGTLITHSESSLTIEMKSKLRMLLQQGLSDDQVLDNMVEEYGKKMNLPPNQWQRIRATPKKEGFNLMAWILPITLSVAGIILVSWIVYSFVSRSAKTTVAVTEEEPVNPEIEKKIEEELKNLEVS